MDLAVGSQNPVKEAATERAAPAGSSITPVGVDSGVSEQPTGHAETRRGARNRARRALAAAERADVGVGIEGGVARFAGGPAHAEDDPTPPHEDPLFLVMWAAATDGGRWGVASGPALVLPDTIAARVEAGEELGPVMDDVLGEHGVARDQGAAGALTGGGTDRTAALSTAVAGALGPFVTEHYG